jgi:hypothetical protein
MQTRVFGDRRTARVGQRKCRTARGAALIEALIVSSLVILLLGCSILVHRVYRAKLRAMNAVQTSTWVAALNGCGNAPDPEGPATTAGAFADGEPQVSEESITSTLLTPMQTASHTETIPLVGSPNAKQDVKATNSVACNEVPTGFALGPVMRRVAGIVTQ